MSVSFNNSEVNDISQISNRTGYLGPTIVVQWGTFSNIATGGRWVTPLEAGNPIVDAPNAWFFNNNFLFGGAGSSDTTGFSYARWIIRGTGTNGTTTATLQTQIRRNDEQVYSNIGASWTHQCASFFRGYQTSTSPWFQLSGGDRQGISIVVTIPDGDFRIGSVYLQFR